MTRTVYVNGDYVPEDEARISVFDRGFLMADAVYEVTAVIDGKLIDFPGHMARLRRSLGELELTSPVDEAEMEAIHREMIARNNLNEGGIYLQVTRGAADRDFAFPENATPKSACSSPKPGTWPSPRTGREGIKVITLPDIRWGRRDIKTVQLLAPSLAKMAAKKAGKDDAWMVEEGHVTEGSSNNAYIVTRDGVIVTRDLSHAILHGITRAAVLAFAREAQMRVEERPFTVAEAHDAAEAFITSASACVTPVIEIDGEPVGDGVPGPVAKRLREIYLAESLKHAS